MRYTTKTLPNDPHTWMVLDTITRTYVKVRGGYTMDKLTAVTITRALNS